MHFRATPLHTSPLWPSARIPVTPPCYPDCAVHGGMGLLASNVPGASLWIRYLVGIAIESRWCGFRLGVTSFSRLSCGACSRRSKRDPSGFMRSHFLFLLRWQLCLRSFEVRGALCSMLLWLGYISGPLTPARAAVQSMNGGA